MLMCFLDSSLNKSKKYLKIEVEIFSKQYSLYLLDANRISIAKFILTPSQIFKKRS